MTTIKAVFERINVLEDGQIEVRQRDTTQVNGVDYYGRAHGHVVAPGDDLGREHPYVRAIAGVVHTPEVIAAFRAARDRDSQDAR